MTEHDERWRRRAWMGVLLVWLAAAMAAMRCGELARQPVVAPPPEPVEAEPRQCLVRSWIDVMYLNAIAGRQG